MSDRSQIAISPTVVIPASELRFQTSRSGGPGGQNVNKLETKVELTFDILHSRSLSDAQKLILLHALRTRLAKGGILRVSSQQSRSQWKNKQEAINRFVRLLSEALKPQKKRTRTVPGRAARERRVRGKKIIGEKKKQRRFNLERE